LPFKFNLQRYNAGIPRTKEEAQKAVTDQVLKALKEAGVGSTEDLTPPAGHEVGLCT
jgi:hypothetical protein